jgi:putative transposase
MARKHLIRTADAPYHVYNRSNNKEFFYIPLEKLWPICLECLHELQIRYGCEIIGFVLMSNHYHLLIWTPKENLGEAMKYFHREVARRANRLAGRTNHFWGGRYKWSLIGTEYYYWNVTKYVFRNPVKSGICKSVNDYQFSSLNQPSFPWQMTDFFNEPNRLIELNDEWLNEPFFNEEEEAIKKALRRREFKLPKDKNRTIVRLPAPHPRKGTVTFKG